jgi:hypothetical protein
MGNSSISKSTDSSQLPPQLNGIVWRFLRWCNRTRTDGWSLGNGLRSRPRLADGWPNSSGTDGDSRLDFLVRLLEGCWLGLVGCLGFQVSEAFLLFAQGQLSKQFLLLLVLVFWRE